MVNGSPSVPPYWETGYGIASTVIASGSALGEYVRRSDYLGSRYTRRMKTAFAMNPIGRFAADVEEVVAFVKSKRLLSGPFQKDLVPNVKTLTVFSLSDVVDKYRDPEPICPGAKIKGYAWIDIIKANAHDFHTAIAHDDVFKDQIWPELDQLSRSLWPIIQECTEGIVGEASVDIFEQIDALIRYRAALGKVPNSLSEQFFAVYQANGYACGWSGRYPKGKLVVFSRHFSNPVVRNPNYGFDTSLTPPTVQPHVSP